MVLLRINNREVNMIKVEKTAETLLEGVNNMMAGAKEDYIRMSTSNGKKELSLEYFSPLQKTTNKVCRD